VADIRRKWLVFELLVRSGALISVAGIALFVAFVAVLLVFPVVKSCNTDKTGCTFASTAPDPFRSIINPGYLAASLLVIAGGVFLLRFARWRESKKNWRR
jgi:hypothetical protein